MLGLLASLDDVNSRDMAEEGAGSLLAPATGGGEIEAVAGGDEERDVIAKA